MTHKSIFASILSLIVPGLGQIRSGKGERGAIILIAAILVGNLNNLWLSLYGLTSPGTNPFWTSALPKILRDVFAAWSVGFYLWQGIDSYHHAK